MTPTTRAALADRTSHGSDCSARNHTERDLTFAELMAGRIPADVPAFEHRNAGAEARGFQRDRQAGKPRANHADVDIEIERKALALLQRRDVGLMGCAGSLAHGFCFLRTDRVLVTLVRRPEPEFSLDIRRASSANFRDRQDTGSRL